MDWLKPIIDKILEQSWGILVPIFLTLGAYFFVPGVRVWAAGEPWLSILFLFVTFSLLYKITVSALHLFKAHTQTKEEVKKRELYLIEREEELSRLLSENQALKENVGMLEEKIHVMKGNVSALEEKIRKDEYWRKNVPIAGKI